MPSTTPDPSTSRTTTNAATSADAETWQRVVARLVDHVLLAVVTAVALAPLGLGASVLPGTGYLAGAVGSVLAAAATVGYFTVLESRDGRTLGKRLLGIRVVTADGATPRVDEALRRNLWTGLGMLGVVPLVGGVVGGLATLVAAVTILLGIVRTGQGWHDEAAGGTCVVAAG